MTRHHIRSRTYFLAEGIEKTSEDPDGCRARQDDRPQGVRSPAFRPIGFLKNTSAYTVFLTKVSLQHKIWT